MVLFLMSCPRRRFSSLPPFVSAVPHFELDENEDDGRQAQAKKRHLEPLLDVDARFLLHEYNSREELLKIFERIVEMEDLVRPPFLLSPS